MSKSFFPELYIVSCDGKTNSTQYGITVTHHPNQPWYQSVVGILFVVVIFVLIMYVISVLSVIHGLLKQGDSLSATEFVQIYGIERETLLDFERLFTIILVIMTCVIAVLIWTTMPQRLKCILFNQYSLVALMLVMFFLSIYSDVRIPNKAIPKSSFNMLNGLALTFSGLFLLSYTLLILNHHFKFFKLT